jgi:hypothetical protein
MDGTKALVPSVVVPFIERAGRRRVARTGLTLPGETVVALEPGTGKVVPIDPRIEPAPGALDELPEIVPVGEDRRLVVEQPVTVDAVVSIGWGHEPAAPVTRGIGLYRLGLQVLNLELLGGAAVEGLRPVVEGARCYELATGKAAAMLDGLVQMFHAA